MVSRQEASFTAVEGICMWRALSSAALISTPAITLSLQEMLISSGLRAERKKKITAVVTNWGQESERGECSVCGRTCMGFICVDMDKNKVPIHLLPGFALNQHHGSFFFDICTARGKHTQAGEEIASLARHQIFNHTVISQTIAGLIVIGEILECMEEKCQLYLQGIFIVCLVISLASTLESQLHPSPHLMLVPNSLCPRRLPEGQTLTHTHTITQVILS